MNGRDGRRDRGPEWCLSPEEERELDRQEAQALERWERDARAGRIQFADGFTYAELTDPEWWRKRYPQGIEALSEEERAEFFAESARRHEILSAAKPRIHRSRRRAELKGAASWPLDLRPGAPVVVDWGEGPRRGAVVGLRRLARAGLGLVLDVGGLRWAVRREDGGEWARRLDAQTGLATTETWLAVSSWPLAGETPGPGTVLPEPERGSCRGARFKGLLSARSREGLRDE